MSDTAPQVSVLMPVYNGARYLRAAVDSILSQTLRDFELIAVDDGSTDGSGSLLADYQAQDARLRLLRQPSNQGIVAALNLGLQQARGEFIARMDCDDISHPDRLARQVAFLQAHPQVGMLGTDALFIDPDGRRLARMGHPREDLSIRWTSLLANFFFHPTLMFRRSILVENGLLYRAEFTGAEDYDLWVRMLPTTRAANLPLPLVRYRVHPHSLSSRKELDQADKHVLISRDHLDRVLPEVHLDPLEHRHLVAAFTGRLNPSLSRLRPALARRYLELWGDFSRLHAQEEDLPRLKHQVAGLAAKIGLFPPFKPGWRQALDALFRVDPLWWVYFCWNLAKMMGMKLTGIRLGQFRRVEP